MLRRRQSTVEPPTEGPTAGDDEPRPAGVTPGKGRPTPKRGESHSRRRAVAPKTRKEAAALQRSRARESRQLQRRALVTGDERNLPARDAGPARRLARDVVDVRFSIGQVLFGLIAVVFLLSLLRIPLLQLVANVASLLLLVVMVGDGLRHARQARAMVVDRYGEQAAQGVSSYALLRALMPRRLRRPPPRVSRGDVL